MVTPGVAPATKECRYRVDLPIRIDGMTVRTDVAFPGKRVAVLIDGCFWHGCEQHCWPAKTSLTYWQPKIDGDVARDGLQTRRLQEAGWIAARVWEHTEPLRAVNAVQAAVGLPGPRL